MSTVSQIAVSEMFHIYSLLGFDEVTRKTQSSQQKRGGNTYRAKETYRVKAFKRSAAVQSRRCDEAYTCQSQ